MYILSGITQCKIPNYLTWLKKVAENKVLLGLQYYCAYRTNKTVCCKLEY